MRLLGPGDRAMIDRALAHARAAGVPEATIQQVIEREGAGRGGAVIPAMLAGRLNALAREFQSRGRPGV